MPEDKIIYNKELSLWEALIPVIVLVVLLAFNVYVFGDNALSGSNQFVLLLGAAVAAIVGFTNGVGYDSMIAEIGDNLLQTTGAILILLMVGSLSAAWLVSGIIPAMVYYGIQILNPTIFFPACVVICAIISIATGSSWSTSATVGIALVGIGTALGMPAGMTAGAVISGAYFGDKMSPLSDTTNLAAAMAGTDLFRHIKYMSLTTIPSITITLLIFTFLGLFRTVEGSANYDYLLSGINNSFHITPWLFIVPVLVIYMIIRKTKPVIALFIGTLLGGLFAILFQSDILQTLSGTDSLDFESIYKSLMTVFTEGATVQTDNEQLNDLFSSGGMAGMLGTIWLIICALVFGGVMEAIGALTVISQSLLRIAKSVFGLFASTVASCIAINVTASDQYLSIVVPGKMFKKAFDEKGLAPENLSRTLEDSGTVTSVLIPWNTCGAYQASVLGVPAVDYALYAFFNYISPLMTLFFALFSIKIKMAVNS